MPTKVVFSPSLVRPFILFKAGVIGSSLIYSIQESSRRPNVLFNCCPRGSGFEEHHTEDSNRSFIEAVGGEEVEQ